MLGMLLLIQGKHRSNWQCNSLTLWNSNKGSPEVVSILWLLHMAVPFDFSSILLWWLLTCSQSPRSPQQKWSHHNLSPSLLSSVCGLCFCLHTACASQGTLWFLSTELLLQDTCCFLWFAQLSECVCWFGPFHPIMLTVSQVTVFNWEQSRASLLMQLDKESTCSSFFWVSHFIVLAVDLHNAIIVPNSSSMDC